MHLKGISVMVVIAVGAMVLIAGCVGAGHGTSSSQTPSSRTSLTSSQTRTSSHQIRLKVPDIIVIGAMMSATKGNEELMWSYSGTINYNAKNATVAEIYKNGGTSKTRILTIAGGKLVQLMTFPPVENKLPSSAGARDKIVSAVLNDNPYILLVRVISKNPKAEKCTEMTSCSFNITLSTQESRELMVGMGVNQSIVSAFSGELTGTASFRNGLLDLVELSGKSEGASYKLIVKLENGES